MSEEILKARLKRSIKRNVLKAIEADKLGISNIVDDANFARKAIDCLPNTKRGMKIFAKYHPDTMKSLEQFIINANIMRELKKVSLLGVSESKPNLNRDEVLGSNYKEIVANYLTE